MRVTSSRSVMCLSSAPIPAALQHATPRRAAERADPASASAGPRRAFFLFFSVCFEEPLAPAQ
ncbi:hypothetical protein E2C01_022768 [Portunus trituberculatus]|uniref:Uncharacterized protein n=1 Tax=Portunus trituberculatus TaxID=210409 RepID=A0A5B7E686_PORTR|nr:hypothetical protein [Portunus trituberculatus]